MVIALAGNPNSGKTALFNKLTGKNQRVGNFPGVTVCRKEGYLQGYRGVTVVDLPGVYSLSPYSKEETVTQDFLIYEKPDCIINVIDATDIERSLYLSLQLCEMNAPVVIAVNMIDEINANGGKIDTESLEKLIGVRAVQVSAIKNIGIEKLAAAAVNATVEKKGRAYRNFFSGDSSSTVRAIEDYIDEYAEREGVPARFAAVRLAQGDLEIAEKLKISPTAAKAIKNLVHSMELSCNADAKTVIAQNRYKFIESVCNKTVVSPKRSRHHARSMKIDNFLLHDKLAIPFFLLTMLAVFWISFGSIGAKLSDVLYNTIATAGSKLSHIFEMLNIEPVICSLVLDGIIGGVGAVVSFIPTVLLLFFLLSLLEDSGYMARVAFIADKLMQKIGLTGRSFVPMLVGLGCSVPAVMSTRTLTGYRERRLAVLLIPFISCSAKLPVYSLFISSFFAEFRVVIIFSLYIVGIVLGVVGALLLKDCVMAGESVHFMMTLPDYRLPGFKNTLHLLKGKCKDFISRAFSVVLICSVTIWFLQSFDVSLNYTCNNENSILAYIGNKISPAFLWSGFNDWRACAALVTGVGAKETVISTLTVLSGGVVDGIKEIFTPLSAVSFMVFTLLYTPCIATINTVRIELGRRWALFLMLYQTFVAWLCSAVVYTVGGYLIKILL